MIPIGVYKPSIRNKSADKLTFRFPSPPGVVGSRYSAAGDSKIITITPSETGAHIARGCEKNPDGSHRYVCFSLIALGWTKDDNYYAYLENGVIILEKVKK